MPYEGEQPLSPIELQARGLLPPGPLSPPLNPATPTANEKAISDQAVANVGRVVNPQPEGLALMGQGAQMTGMGTQTPLGMFMSPTGKDVARAAVPAVAGYLLPQGRTFTRAGGQILGNMLGSGAVELGSEMMKPSEEQNKTQAFIKGSIEGVLPGLASGVGGAIAGPNKATIQANKAIKILTESPEISPNVAGILNAENPAGLYSRKNLRGMQQEAGSNLDAMEEVVSKALGNTEFELPSKALTYMGQKTGIAFPKTFGQIREEIKSLRNLGERPYSQGPMGVTSEQARAAQNEAAQLSKDLVKAMREKGLGKWADIYEEATSQYAKDKEAIRYVQAKQRERALPGGTTPEDRPDLAKAEKILSPISPSIPHGAVGAIEAGTMRPFGAMYHLGRFFDSMAGARSPVAQQMPGPLRRISGPLAGAGASYLEKPNFQSTGE